MIETVHISDWNKKYKHNSAGTVILDGESWDVVYKEAGFDKIKSSGDNAFPANWSMLKKVLAKTVGNIELD